MIVAKEISISGSLTGSTKSYNTSSILLGSLIKTYTDTSGSMYASPLEIVYERPYENLVFKYDTTLNFRDFSALKYSDDVDYLFYSNTSAIYGFRPIFGYKFTKSLNKFDPLGVISVFPRYTGFGPFPAQPLSLGRPSGFLYRYNSGSVTVINNITSSLVSGSNTNWDGARIHQGARIGFGTNDYTQVKDWYEIIDVPTSNRLIIPFGLSYTSSVPYVIEELKIFCAIRHQASSSFNGLLAIHGLNESTFSPGVTAILNQYSSSAQDRQRGHYKMSDNPYSSSIVQGGSPYSVAIEPEIVSPTEQYAHLSSFNTNPVVYQLYKFNILYPAISSSFSASWSGSAVGNMMFATDRWVFGFSQGEVNGGNTLLAKPAHGPGSGSYSIYRIYRNNNAVGASWRIYRAPLTPTRYYTASLSSIADYMFPVPPGTTAMRPNMSGLQFQYVPSIDRFYMSSETEGWYGRGSLFKFDTNFSKSAVKQVLYNHSVMYSRFTTINENQPRTYINSSDPTPTLTISEDMLYLGIGGYNLAPFGNHFFSAIPIGANYEDAPNTKQWVTFPPMDTSNARSYRSVYLQHPRFLGADNLGFPTERMVIFYRTSGIADDSGQWIRLNDNGDLSDVPVANQIQFSVSFDVLGMTATYNRLHGICLTYEDLEQDSHYLQSLQRSDIANNRIVWVQTKKWNKPIPELKVNIYNAENDQLLLNDSTDVQSQGTFEYSTNGGSTYLLWNNNQDQIGNYVRYTANYLPANTRIRVVLNLK